MQGIHLQLDHETCLELLLYITLNSKLLILTKLYIYFGSCDNSIDTLLTHVLKVFPAIRRFTKNGAEFVDGRLEDFDAVVLATGYKSNVPAWLKVRHRIIACDFWSEYND